MPTAIDNGYRPRQNLFYFDLAGKDNVHDGDDRVSRVSGALAGKSRNVLKSLEDYLWAALLSIENEQASTAVKWSKVESKGRSYALIAKNTWIKISWPTLFILNGWGPENGPFNVDTVGIERSPYRLDIHPHESGCGIFTAKDEVNEAVLLKMVSTGDSYFRTDRGRFSFDKFEPKFDKNTIRTSGGKTFNVIRFEQRVNGCHLLIDPVPSNADLSDLDFDDLFFIETKQINKERPEDDYFDSSENKIILRKVEGRYRREDGKEIKSSTLISSSGIEYEVREASPSKKGCVITLEEVKTNDTDLTIDPRYSFFEQNVKEIWLDKNVHRNDDKSIRVIRGDSDNYQLVLDRFPPDDCKYLYLPKNTQNIKNQLKAAYLLREMPLEHHRDLIRLFEDPKKAMWKRNGTSTIIGEEEWCFLDKPSIDGTKAERQFVTLAVDTEDFAFLEGPPGSGKTTTIAELVYQLAIRGKKVLVVSNTHYAIDNLLERLVNNEKSLKVTSPLRIGRDAKKIDDNVDGFYIQTIVEQLKERAALKHLNEAELRELVYSSANIVCATTTGIGDHPKMDLKNIILNQQRREVFSKGSVPLAQPLFDYLIIDESSKSTFQEFLYPAIFAKKWVLVGDVKQLSPYTEEKEIIGSVRSTECLKLDHCRALRILFELFAIEGKDSDVGHERWVAAVPSGVLEYLVKEIELRANGSSVENAESLVKKLIVVAGKNKGGNDAKKIRFIDVDSLDHEPSKWNLIGLAEWLFVTETDYCKIEKFIQPSTMILVGEGSCSRNYKHESWLGFGDGERRLPTSKFYDHERKMTYRQLECAAHKKTNKTDWAQEWTWRVRRINELKNCSEGRGTKKYISEVGLLEPTFDPKGYISRSLEEIRSLAFPSILESVQFGIDLAVMSNRNEESCLSRGLGVHFNDHHILLEYQHRMEPCISRIAREQFYDNKALKNSNILKGRRLEIGFTYPEDCGVKIFQWVDVKGTERFGRNEEEVEKMVGNLDAFEKWARDHPRKQKHQNTGRNAPWSVAALSFYLGQEDAIVKRLREWSNDDRNKRYRIFKGNVEVAIGTIDRFQGREADMVLLSLRNTDHLGFMDSLNRINVAVTRARYQLTIIGNLSFFSTRAQRDVPQWSRIAQHQCEKSDV